tara:strand:- start:3436 stop:4857 length:1422 start_codon:yes stop_codon:yes gene_type:complete
VTELWPHQRQAIAFAYERSFAQLALDMGTGKTLSAITLARKWQAKRILVLCPLSVIPVWGAELEKHAPRSRYELLNEGSIGQKTKHAKLAVDIAAKRKEPVFIIINYESFWREPFRYFSLNCGWDLIVFDESHRIKAPGGKASRFSSLLARGIPHRLGLTGTPTPHSPADIYAQLRAIDPRVFGNSFSRFKARYAVMGGFQGHNIIGWKNTVEMDARVASVCFAVKKRDVLDLPPVTVLRRTFELSPPAMKAYRNLHFDLYTRIESGEITASNALVKLLRLQQITSGFVRDDNDVIHAVDDGKASMLNDLLSDLPADEPVVVFCRFLRDLDCVRETTELLKRSYGEVSGRHKDLVGGKYPPGIQILGVQIQSGGLGIDLSRAAYAIYYSVGFSLGDYEQSVARLDRAGQTRPVSIYHLVANGTVDETIYGSLKQKKEVIEQVLRSINPKGGDANARREEPEEVHQAGTTTAHA